MSSIDVLTEAAQYFQYSTSQCATIYNKFLADDELFPQAFKWENQWNCADAIVLIFEDFTMLATAISSALFTCGGIETGCAQQGSAISSQFAFIAEDLLDVDYECHQDGLHFDGNLEPARRSMKCAVAIIDVATDCVYMAQLFEIALEVCDTSFPGATQQDAETQQNIPEYLPGASNIADERAGADGDAGDLEAAGPTGAKSLGAFFPGLGPIGPSERRLADAPVSGTGPSRATSHLSEILTRREAAGTLSALRSQVRSLKRSLQAGLLRSEFIVREMVFHPVDGSSGGSGSARRLLLRGSARGRGDRGGGSTGGRHARADIGEQLSDRARWRQLAERIGRVLQAVDDAEEGHRQPVEALSETSQEEQHSNSGEIFE